MHFAVAAEYKRAPFCPRGVLRQPLSIVLSRFFSLSFFLSFPAYHHLYLMHTLIRSVRAYTHERAPFAFLSLVSSPLSSHSLFFSPISFFAPSVCFYVWTSKVRRKGCCALRVRNLRDIDKNKVHPHLHPQRASPIVGN